MLEYFGYLKVLISSRFIKDREQVIFFDISSVAINRYLYSFLKMFQIAGYTVYIPKSRKTIKILNQNKGEFKYASWLLAEKVVKFGKPGKAMKEIEGHQLSNNYFSEKNSHHSYQVPMSFYPWFYRNFHSIKLRAPSEMRKNSIFMSGNIDPKYYDKISGSKFFKIPSRKKVAEALSRSDYYFPVHNKAEFENFINGNEDQRVIIINSEKHFRIELENLFEVLQKFRFYLALPGITIPQSHNITEAIFCKCIPVIHKEYACLMTPPLENNKTAFTYEDIDDLLKMVPNIFRLSENQIQNLQQNLSIYYRDYLSPEAVVNKVIQNGYSKIYIQAEHISIYLRENE